MITVIVRAFNKDNYHKDIVLMDSQQVQQHDNRVRPAATLSMWSGLTGVGCGIDPADFPEMVRFEVVIRDDR